MAVLICGSPNFWIRDVSALLWRLDACFFPVFVAVLIALFLSKTFSLLVCTFFFYLKNTLNVNVWMKRSRGAYCP